MSEWQTRKNWDRRSDPRENERTGFARGFVDGFVETGGKMIDLAAKVVTFGGGLLIKKGK